MWMRTSQAYLSTERRVGQREEDLPSNLGVWSSLDAQHHLELHGTPCALEVCEVDCEEDWSIKEQIYAQSHIWSAENCLETLDIPRKCIVNEESGC